MRRPDPLLMLADIARIASERPELDEGLVRAIYQHQVLTSGRQPTLQQAHAYIEHLTVRLDDATLRATLGLGPGPGRRANEPGETVNTAPDVGEARSSGRGAVARQSGRPGRPAWTRDLFWARYRVACSSTPPPHTYRSVAPAFESLDGTVGIDPEHLRKLAGRYGLPPE